MRKRVTQRGAVEAEEIETKINHRHSKKRRDIYVINLQNPTPPGNHYAKKEGKGLHLGRKVPAGEKIGFGL